MSDRPTPEQVLDMQQSHPWTGEYAVHMLRDAGMVVGYPDDPEVVRAVLHHMYDDDTEPGSRERAMSFVTHPKVRRAVLAALPEELPDFDAERWHNDPWGFYRWLREEAFNG